MEVKAPAAPVIDAALRLNPGRALDIACGAGRHAIWLRHHGWQVTAVDRDADAIARLQQADSLIDARIWDLEQQPFPIAPGEYDLIVCWLYLQRDLYPKIREGIRPGGIAALSVLLYSRFAARPGELSEYFADWRVLHQSENERMSELVVSKDYQPKPAV